MTPAQAEYRHYLTTYRWRILRTLRLWIDGGRCRMCGRRSSLECHHRDYTHRGRNWWRELMDLTTVCRACHGDYHDGD